MHIQQKSGSLFGGILLIAGTAIGGGMLALPVLTAAGGFLPATLVHLLCWLFMSATGILMLEVVLWKKEETNLVSMAKFTFGLPGQIFAWILYLFLFYSLTLAYISGGGDLFNEVLSLFFAHPPAWLGKLLFLALFAPCVYVGANLVDKVNGVLVIGLFISFVAFLCIGYGHVQNAHLLRMNWPLAFAATPVVFISFAYQGTVPTLANYLQRDVHKARLAIVIGSAIPLLIYLVWEWLILGIVPLHGSNGLLEARLMGQTAVVPLKGILNFPWLFRVGEFFAFFAIVTSFLGVTLGMLDFLADGLKVKKTAMGRLALCAIIFLPPFLLSIKNPKLFLIGLHYAGGVGSALLLGLLPIAMAWRGRYRMGIEQPPLLPGGRPVLSLLLLFILLELTLMVTELI